MTKIFTFALFQFLITLSPNILAQDLIKGDELTCSDGSFYYYLNYDYSLQNKKFSNVILSEEKKIPFSTEVGSVANYQIKKIETNNSLSFNLKTEVRRDNKKLKRNFVVKIEPEKNTDMNIEPMMVLIDGNKEKEIPCAPNYRLKLASYFRSKFFDKKLSDKLTIMTGTKYCEGTDEINMNKCFRDIMLQKWSMHPNSGRVEIPNSLVAIDVKMLELTINDINEFLEQNQLSSSINLFAQEMRYSIKPYQAKVYYDQNNIVYDFIGVVLTDELHKTSIYIYDLPTSN